MSLELVEWDARRDTVRRPKTKMQSRLRVLRQSWRQSILRIVVLEIYNLPRRILAILRTPLLRLGAEIPRGTMDRGNESFGQENVFQCACTQHMEELKSENQWLGHLEIQVAAISFQRGARWAHGNIGNQIDNGESP
jgi:hypothetical protein